MGRLSEKVALITGSGNGIGKASALAFATEGARLIMVDCCAESVKAVEAEVLSAGGTTLVVIGDISDARAVQAIVEAGIDRFGKIDVLFNLAGGGSTKDGPVTELDLDEFWHTIKIDLYGTLLMCRRVIPEMVKAGGGSIINTSSLRAMIGSYGADAYTASKGGILTMSRAMAMQWAAKGIRVNVIAPGVVLTDRVAAFIKPDDPIYQKALLGPCAPEDIAHLALFLASDEARKITGATMRIDGGASIY